MASILVVDDEKSIRNTVKAFLVREALFGGHTYAQDFSPHEKS